MASMPNTGEAEEKTEKHCQNMNNRKQSKYLAFTVKKNDELLPFIEKALNGISHTKAKAILANGGAMVNKNTITQNL